jgi:voltage-gated sodium channel
MTAAGKKGANVPGDAFRHVPPPQGGRIGKVQAVLESAPFQRTITALIVINAVTLGLETSAAAREAAGDLLTLFDRAILSVFVIEISAKLVVYRTRFHRDVWNVFDFIVVAIALVPATGSLSVLRALRVLRVLRLVSSVPSMRRVVTALLYAIPGMGSIIALMTLIYYVFSVMATNLFGGTFPELFGDLAASAFSLFQIMTLEGWAAEIVRPVMEKHPYAWAFFVPFMLVTTFTVLNLFIGIIVDAMQRQHQADREEDHAEEVEFAQEGRSDRAEILAEIQALRREVAALKLR